MTPTAAPRWPDKTTPQGTAALSVALNLAGNEWSGSIPFAALAVIVVVVVIRVVGLFRLALLLFLRRRILHRRTRLYRWSLHLLRGLIGVLMLSLFAFAIRELALAEAYTIFFIAPLLITLLSIPILKERVRPTHWIAIAVGMLGVIIAMRPNQEAFFSLGALAVLAAASCYAISAVAGSGSLRKAVSSSNSPSSSASS